LRITMYFVFFSFFLCLSSFVSLSLFFVFLVASFDGLRPVLVTSHCSLCSLAKKLRSFVRVHNEVLYKSTTTLPLSESYTETEISDAQWASHVVGEEICLYFLRPPVRRRGMSLYFAEVLFSCQTPSSVVTARNSTKVRHMFDSISRS